MGLSVSFKRCGSLHGSQWNFRSIQELISPAVQEAVPMFVGGALLVQLVQARNWCIQVLISFEIEIPAISNVGWSNILTHSYQETQCTLTKRFCCMYELRGAQINVFFWCFYSFVVWIQTHLRNCQASARLCLWKQKVVNYRWLLLYGGYESATDIFCEIKTIRFQTPFLRLLGKYVTSPFLDTSTRFLCRV